MDPLFGRGTSPDAGNRRPEDPEPPQLRICGAHVVDRYLVVEWFSRLSDVKTYRHLWWLGHS
jgi:hypothetical protein